MTARRLARAVSLSIVLTAGPALAIELGDPAPPLKIADWIKGGPVDLKEGKGKQVVVIEFWATWCRPCRAGIPHLTELQKKLKDRGVVILGVSTEDTEEVKPFVKDADDKMDFVVAVDRDEATHKAYMDAFDIEGIPHAFVVDKTGKLVWHGYPAADLDRALDEILAGKYDIEVAKKIDKARKLAPQYFETVQKMDMAGQDKEKKELARKARETGEAILKDGAKSAHLLNGFAWTILDSDEIKTRDLDLAMRAAKAAYDASEGKDASVVDTYARAFFDTGKKSEAIKYQKKAVELCKDERMAADLKKTLERYQKAAGGKE